MNRFAKMGVLIFAFASMPLLMAPRNGAGTYSLPAGNPVVSGTTISSTVHNNTMSDIATALTGSLTKDGQTTSTANQPMGGFRHTNVGNPTVRNQYGTVDNIQDGEYLTLGSVAGTDTITGALSPTITAYVAGMHVILIPANANTGAATLNVSSVGALDVQKYNSGGQVNIVANDLRAGVPALLVLDTGADDWVLLNPYSGSLGDVTVGALTATGVTTTTLTLNGNAVGGAANPTASVGLSAVNGVATTYMRSDGAPALSQAIAPTWSAGHTFGLVNYPVTLSSGTPGLLWTETDGALNNKNWWMFSNAEQFRFSTQTDALGGTTDIMTIDRTGTTVDRVAFPAEASGGFSIGTPSGGFINNTRAYIRSSTATTTALQVASPSATATTVFINNEAAAGDNVFVTFATDGAGLGSTRGSIDYNRAGGVVRYNTTSDQRLKKNIRPAGSARHFINSIPIDEFDWKETGIHVEHGFVAQRLNRVAPDCVSKPGDPKGRWQVEKSCLVPALIRMVQEQDARISRLEADAARRH